MANDPTQRASPFYQKSSFWKRLGYSLAGLFVVYLLIGFFLLPWIIKGQVEKQVEAITGRTASVEKVRLNPLLLTFTMEGFSIAGGTYPQRDTSTAGEDPSLIGFDRLFVDASIRSIRHFAPVLKEVRLEGPSAHLARLADGSLNIQDILDHIAANADPADTASGELPRFWVDRLEIVGGAFELRDALVEPLFVHRTDPIDLAVSDFGILRSRAGEGQLEATTDTGSRFAWEGEVHLDPPASSGRLIVENIELESFHPYFTPYLSVSLGKSRFSLDVEYAIDTAPGAELLQVHNGRVRLDELAVGEREHPEQAFLTLHEVTIEGLEAALTAFDVSIAKLHATEGIFKVERGKDGSIALLDLIQLPPAPEMEATDIPTVEASAIPPVTFKLGTFQVDRFEIEYHDESFAEPFRYPLSVGRFTLQHLTHVLDEPVDLSFEGSFGGEGLIRTEGSLTAMPLSAELAIEVQEMPLAPLRSIATGFMAIGPMEGRAGFTGKLTAKLDLEAEAGTLPEARIEGSATISGLRIEEPDTGNALVAFEQLSFKSMDARTEPMVLNIAEVLLEKPALYVSRDQSGQLNWLALLPEADEALATTESAEPSTPASSLSPAQQIEALQETLHSLPIAVSIPRIQLEQASVRFIDEAVEPFAEERVEPINLTLTNFTLKEPKRVELELDARLRGRAELEGSGHWVGSDWLEDFRLDLKLSPFQLPPLSPYSSAFIARAIGSGDLSFELSYSVEQSRLRGSQSILLESFNLGEHTPREGALNLPVGLAVSLLRDRHGNIQLNVPLSGDLNDPRFSLGGVFASAFGNILQRAATAPFSLLGSVFAGARSGEEAPDLSYVTFLPGKPEPDAVSEEKLEILARALYDRPSLILYFQADSISPADKAFLLQQQLRGTLLQEMPSEISEEEQEAYYAQAVTLAYTEWKQASEAEEKTDSERKSLPIYTEGVPEEERGTTVTETIESSSIIHIGQASSSRRPAARAVSSQETVTRTERRPIPERTPRIQPAGSSAEELPPLEEMELHLLSALELEEARTEALLTARETKVRSLLLELESIESERLRRGTGSVSDTATEPPPGSVHFSIE